MMAARMSMGHRPKSAGTRPSSAGGRPSSASRNRPSTANGRLSSYDERPSSSGGRPSSSNGRPSSATREPVTVDEKGRPRYRTQRERVAERLEHRRERKAEKARLKAERPKLEHVDWRMRARALWMMFSMSYYTKVVLGLGVLMLFIAIILIAIGVSTEEDLKDADTITALLFVFGLLFIVISVFAIRSRRREKDNRRRLGYDKKTGRYGPDIPKENGTNGTIPTISEDVDDSPRGHINGIPLQDRKPFSVPKPQKPKFSAVRADEETGFTNLSVVMDADQLPGTPYRQRRRESIEESLTTFNSNKILASSSLKDDPDILVVPPPRDKLSVSSKSGDGRKVKKSKSPNGSPNKPTLDDIPEVITTAPISKSSTTFNKAPPITIIDTDELEEEFTSSTVDNKKKHDYTNDGFDDGDITPNDLV